MQGPVERGVKMIKQSCRMLTAKFEPEGELPGLHKTEITQLMV
jgi:hypothetical protein